MTNYPSNSKGDRSARPPDIEDKKVVKVVQSDVVTRRKPLSRRFKDAFIGEDAGSVWAFVTNEVLLPAAKDTIAEAVSSGIERMIFGSERPAGRRGSSRGSGPYVDYSRYSGSRSSRKREPDPRPSLSRQARARHDFDEIIIPTRVEADEVLERMYDLLSRYQVVTVADLYDLVGLEGAYTDNKWGWTELPGAQPYRVRGSGYVLDLPRPEPLN